MKYNISYYTDDSKCDYLLQPATYKSDVQAIQGAISFAKARNRLRTEHKYEAITVYRLVKRAGEGYWKTIVEKLEI